MNTHAAPTPRSVIRTRPESLTCAQLANTASGYDGTLRQSAQKCRKLQPCFRVLHSCICAVEYCSAAAWSSSSINLCVIRRTRLWHGPHPEQGWAQQHCGGKLCMGLPSTLHNEWRKKGFAGSPRPGPGSHIGGSCER